MYTHIYNCFWIKKEVNKIGQVFAIRCGVTE